MPFKFEVIQDKDHKERPESIQFAVGLDGEGAFYVNALSESRGYRILTVRPSGEVILGAHGICEVGFHTRAAFNRIYQTRKPKCPQE